jgi:hypothetical protein
MSYWSHHPELLDEITIKFLPEPWKSRVENDEIELFDVPCKIMYKAMDEGTEDYWGSKIDEAMMRKETMEVQ